MRISMSAMYFTVDILCVSSATYESTSGLQLLLFVLAPPTAAKREGMWGHPTPRQRALHSALPYVHAQGLRAGSPRPCALCTPYSSGFDESSSNLAWRNKVNISCSSMRKLAVFAFCLALITMSNPPGSLGKRPRIASLSSRFI